MPHDHETHKEARERYIRRGLPFSPRIYRRAKKSKWVALTSPTTWRVISQDDHEHIITVAGDGKLICDCDYFTRGVLPVCSHILAIRLTCGETLQSMSVKE